MQHLLRATAPCVGSRLLTLPLLIGLASASPSALSHGYLSSPESRSYLCKTGLNTHCGAIQWEPQSVEGPDGNPRFPQGGPADGTIAAAGSPAWSELNVQTPTRWHKHNIDAGWQTFQWTFTANHVSRDWRYFLTKPGWNAAEPLSRDAFELAPFCVHDGGMVRPPLELSHDCYLPQREGYHVILAVWDVGDTDASFYNAIDVSFSGELSENPEPPEGVDPIAQVGIIPGAIDLDPGDRIATVVFDAMGELPELKVGLTAERPLSGAEASLLLARQINASGQYYAGRRDGGNYVPELGSNPIFAGPPIERVETRVTFVAQPAPEFSLAISSVPEQITLSEDRMADIPFTVEVNAESAVTATIYGSDGAQIAGDDFVLTESTDLSLHLHNTGPGVVDLVVVARALDTQETRQQTAQIALMAASEPGDIACDASDPNSANYPAFSLSTVYTAGDTVSYNGLVYRAKWWTQGATPDSTDAFELVSEVVLPYSESTAYQGGDLVTYEGGLYEARWWTRGASPRTEPWVYLGESPDCPSL